MRKRNQSPIPSRQHFAEWVSPGHPDRLADAIAERIVDHALALEPRALVGVEVAVHTRRVFVDGRIAANGARPPAEWLHDLVADAYAAAGYRGPWTPRRDELVVEHDLCCADLPDAEREVRGISDDQSVTIGWAGHDERTNFLPPAHYVAHRLGQALARWREEHAADEFGPDFKLLPRFVELDRDAQRRGRSAGEFAWERLTLSIQHRPGMGYEEQFRRLRAPLEEALAELERAGLTGLASSFTPERLHLNGAGAFELGGPHGDNGLSGKKLVVDHYGPTVPIGGGALCGKDPHKVDRVGALRARQLAKSLVPRLAAEALVRVVWAPGLGVPSHVEVEARDAVGMRVPIGPEELPEIEWFGIERAVRSLELSEPSWQVASAAGYFVESTRRWELG
ncbi:MAG: methionine adenosyltransferase domain-containing protein [Planctomycetota bacterium]|nr:methionine adenosyltransferase domain-containing protein [Planctomycetota bacterium]